MQRILPFLLLAGATAFAQAAKPAGAIPRMPDGHPDMSGVWQRPFVQDMTKDSPGQKGEPNLPYTEWSKANLVEEFDYSAFCLPLGYTRSMVDITLGRNPSFTLPALNFAGSPAGTGYPVTLTPVHPLWHNGTVRPISCGRSGERDEKRAVFAPR